MEVFGRGSGKRLSSGQQTQNFTLNPETGYCRETESGILGIIQTQQPESLVILQSCFI